jgi:hypothetical protein
MSNHEFGDSANKPREIDLDEIESEHQQRARYEKHCAATQPWENMRNEAIRNLQLYWTGSQSSHAVPLNKRGNPRSWLGHCPGDGEDWYITWHRAQTCKILEPWDCTLHWFPIDIKRHFDKQSNSVSWTSERKNTDYSEFHKTKWRSDKTARRTGKCIVMLHTTCPSWCPNCGACGVRPTFPGCGREQRPDDEEERLRSVVEQLVEMRPDIRKAAKARTHANGKLEDAKKALKAAENALEASEKAFFPIFNWKLTKAVATAKKAFEICSEASEYASKRYDEESEKYLRVFEENMDVFPEKNLKRFAPPGYRFC